MSNIAEIGFAADTSELVTAKKALDDLPPAAGRAQKASEKLSATLGKVDAAADKIAAAAAGLVSASSNVAAAASGLVAAADRISSALGKQTTQTERTVSATQSYSNVSASVVYSINSLTSATNQAATGITEQGNAAVVASGKMDQLDSHVKAYLANLRQMKIDAMAAGTGTQQLDAHMVAYRDHLDTTAVNARKVGEAIKFTATDSLNATRQLADIGTTLAMGMSPFMVAIQQGPQLLDILQNKAAVTGQSLSAVFRAAAAAIWAALLPILPFVAGIAIALGAVASAFALGTRYINDHSKSIVDGMDLTEKQLERVKKKGVETSVTIGDTFKATFEVLGERFTDAFEKPINKTSKVIDQVFNIWTTWGADTARNIIAAFTAAYYGIAALWKTMPKTFAGIGALIANGFIAVIELMINRALAQVNGINQKINGALKAVGIDFQFADLAPVKLERIANTEASKAADAFAKGANDGWAEGLKKGDRLFADIMARARKNRTKLIEDAAGDPEKGKKPRTPRKKKDPLERLDIQRVYADPFGQKDIDTFEKETAMPTQIGDLIDIPGLDKVWEQYRSQVDFAKEATKGFIDDLRSNLSAGEGLFKSFANAVSSSLSRIFDKLLDKTLNAALEGLFGGNGGGILGSIFGSVGKTAPSYASPFASNGVAPFAKGDVFGSPTLFRYNGGKMGVMGEAGHEAVMPLTRGPNGSLGVQMYGGGGEGGGTFAPTIQINPTYVLQGAMSTADVQRAIRTAGDQQAQDLRKAIPGILQDYQMNGALA